MPTDPLPLDALTLDPETRTVRPVYLDGDQIYGLSPGTNGTAPAHRRALASVPEGYTWVRSSGARATGLQSVPGQRNPALIPTPWGFCGVSTAGDE